MRRVYLAFGCALALASCAWSCGSSNSATPSVPSVIPPVATPTRIIGLTGSLAFGNVQVGNTATSTLTIANSGTAALTINGIALSTGLTGIYSTNWTSGAIAAGGSQPVTVQFAPTSAQSYSGSLTFNGDQTSGTNTIAISGTGTTPLPPPPSTCSYALSIGASIDGYPNGTSLPVTVTTGAGCAWSVSTNVPWIHVSGSGPGPGSFTITIDPNTTTTSRIGTITVAGQTITVNQTTSVTPPAPLSPSFSVTSTTGAGANNCRVDSSGDSNNPALIKCMFDASASTPAAAIASYQFDLVNTGKTLGNQMKLTEPKTSCGFPFNAQVTIRLTITATDGRTASSTVNAIFTKLVTGPC